MSTTAALLLGVALLIGNAFFVAAEFAVISARRHRLEELAGKGGRLTRITARAAVRGGRELSLMLAGAQLGITLCSLGLGMVTEPAVEHLLEPVFGAIGVPESLRVAISLVIALAFITFLHMVVGEMAPKSWALTHPEIAAMSLALPFRGFTWIVRPVLAALNGLTNWILKLFGVHPKDELATTRTPVQLAMLVGESGRMGLLDRDEHDLLTRALRVHQQPVERLMLPLVKATSVPADATGAHMREVAARDGHLRMLVTSGKPGDVLGTVHIRDIIVRPDASPTELVRPVPRLDKATTISDAVSTLQDAHAHLGLVTDGGGEVVGMVSLTDLLGEILGVRVLAAG